MATGTPRKKNSTVKTKNLGKTFFSYAGKKPSELVLSSNNENSYKLYGSKGWSPIQEVKGNTLIAGDNLDSLRLLQKTHKGKVTLIYIDPPYGTGMHFQSRDLKDAYSDDMSTIEWVEFMRKRLILMRELLTKDGSIYVHIGQEMLFHLKIVMDEVFGVKNYKNLITRRKCSSKNYTSKKYPNIHDYVLFYTKSSSYKWNQPGTVPDKAWIDKEYPKTDAKGRYKLVPVHAPGERKGATGQPWKGKMPPKGKHWQMTPEKLDILDSKGEIHWSSTGNPRRKVYLKPGKTIALTDYWADYRDAHHQSVKITGYPTEKNFEMLKMIINASSTQGDIVLDAFSGSGTTAHAAQELGRDWIALDESALAIKTSLKRLNWGMTSMDEFDNSDKPHPTLDLFKKVGFQLVCSDAFIKKNKKEISNLSSLGL